MRERIRLPPLAFRLDGPNDPATGKPWTQAAVRAAWRRWNGIDAARKAREKRRRRELRRQLRSLW